MNLYIENNLKQYLRIEKITILKMWKKFILMTYKNTIYQTYFLQNALNCLYASSLTTQNKDDFSSKSGS